jgi:hypothetical protein
MTPSGACSIIHPISVTNEADVFGKPTPTGLSTEGVFEENDMKHYVFGMYCPQMACVDVELFKLHHRLLRLGDVRHVDIDCFLSICSFLQRSAVGEGSPVATMVRRMKIECMCGQHDVMLETPMTDHFHFDSLGMYQRKQLLRRVRPVTGRYILQHVFNSATIPVSAFVQSDGTTIQYHQLPDLGGFIRMMFTRMYFTPSVKRYISKHLTSTHHQAPVLAHGMGMVESICCSLIQDSIPCMKKAKRSQRGIEFHQPVHETEVTACLNVVLGTLLGVYPRGIKRPTFQARVNLYGRILSLMHEPLQRKLAFLVDHPALTKIAFMEYTYNFMLDFMPCEYNLLLEVDSMQIYRNVCQSTCDSFRQDGITGGGEEWTVLNAVANVCIERCIRMCKFKMLKIADLVIKAPLPVGVEFHRASLDMHNTYGCMNLLKLLHPTENVAVLECALHVHRHISLFAIPAHITRQQEESIHEKYSSCFMRVYQATHTHLCMVCALNGKGINTPLRQCSITGQLTCVVCKPGTVMTINMLGVILHICSMSYYLCPECVKIKSWEGDGNDFNGGSCSAHTPPKTSGIRHCDVCNAKNVLNAPITVPYVAQGKIMVVSLCCKHMPPDHMLPHITEYTELIRAIPKHSKFRNQLLR